MNNEVHRRKRNVQTKIKKAKEALDKAKNDVKMLLDKLEIVKRRIENFEAGDAFNFHRIASSEEAEELEQEATKTTARTTRCFITGTGEAYEPARK